MYRGATVSGSDDLSEEKDCRPSLFWQFIYTVSFIHQAIAHALSSALNGGYGRRGMVRKRIEVHGEAAMWWSVEFRKLGIATWSWRPDSPDNICEWTFWVRRTQARWVKDAYDLIMAKRPPRPWNPNRGAQGWERAVAALFGWKF